MLFPNEYEVNQRKVRLWLTSLYYSFILIGITIYPILLVKPATPPLEGVLLYHTFRYFCHPYE